MASEEKNRVCPVERAGSLDKSLRKLVHNPVKLFAPYLKPGTTALDFGCGPGFFTLGMAQLVGATGKVLAVDLQAGMLDKLRNKIKGTEVSNIIKLIQCSESSLGTNEPVDFINVFWVLHEVPDQLKFLQQLKSLLKEQGRVFLAEPTFHVKAGEFANSVELMKQAGFNIVAQPKVWFSRAVVLG